MNPTDKPLIVNKTLKEQVYAYLRDAMCRGELQPGSSIDLDVTAKRLGVSKTPLRDALLQLNAEGFVTILPRRGVIVSGLSLSDIRQIYEIIGALESATILHVFPKLKKADLDLMDRLIAEMKEALEREDYEEYQRKNLACHRIFLDLSHNRLLQKTIETLRLRLDDFPKRNWIKEWEESLIHEHSEIARLIKAGKKKQAADYLRDVHWSFEHQKHFLVRFYAIAPDAGDDPSS